MSYHAQQVLKYRVLISFKNAIVGEEEKKGASFFLPLQHFLSPKNVYFSPSMPATQQAISFFVLKKKNASTLLDFLLHLFSSHFGIFLESNFKVLSPERERGLQVSFISYLLCPHPWHTFIEIMSTHCVSNCC